MFCSIVASNTAPNDITQIGHEFSTKDHKEKLKNVKFPKTGSDRRSFQLNCLDRYDMIEYSISRDAAFCNTRDNLDNFLKIQHSRVLVIIIGVVPLLKEEDFHDTMHQPPILMLFIYNTKKQNAC